MRAVEDREIADPPRADCRRPRLDRRKERAHVGRKSSRYWGDEASQKQDSEATTLNAPWVPASEVKATPNCEKV